MMGRSASERAWSIRRAMVGGLPWAAWRRSLRDLLRRLLRCPGNVHRARQLLHRLSGLTDHELRDIGLTRRDLDAVRALPFDADPSAELARRAEGRRCRRSAAPGSGKLRLPPP